MIVTDHWDTDCVMIVTDHWDTDCVMIVTDHCDTDCVMIVTDHWDTDCVLIVTDHSRDDAELAVLAASSGLHTRVGQTQWARARASSGGYPQVSAAAGPLLLRDCQAKVSCVMFEIAKWI
jgi:hypothetical protein